MNWDDVDTSSSVWEYDMLWMPDGSGNIMECSAQLMDVLRYADISYDTTNLVCNLLEHLGDSGRRIELSWADEGSTEVYLWWQEFHIEVRVDAKKRKPFRVLDTGPCPNPVYSTPKTTLIRERRHENGKYTLLEKHIKSSIRCCHYIEDLIYVFEENEQKKKKKKKRKT
jgi:hypothetical protein